MIRLLLSTYYILNIITVRHCCIIIASSYIIQINTTNLKQYQRMSWDQIGSVSNSVQSVSLMQLEAGQDSNLLSLFDNIQENEGTEHLINRNLIKKMECNIKSDRQEKNNWEEKEIGGQNQWFDYQIEINKEYYSQNNEGYCEEKGKKKYRKFKVVNKVEKRTKRRRLKSYIEMLQNRCQELLEELEKIKKLNKINKQYIKKLNDSQQLLNGFFVGKQQIYQKLQVIINQAYSQKQKAKSSIGRNIGIEKESIDRALSESNTMYSFTESQQKLLDEVISLRMRLGVFGTDRIKAINYYFREMVQMILPDAQNYLVYTAQNEIDLFSQKYLKNRQHEENIQDWRRQMIQNLNLSSQQMKFVHQLKQKVLQEKKIFDTLLVRFYQNKCQLSKQARKMEAIFDRIHTKMAPISIGMSLMYIEKYRYQKGITSTFDYLKSIIQTQLTNEFSYDSADPFNLKQKNL